MILHPNMLHHLKEHGRGYGRAAYSEDSRVVRHLRWRWFGLLGLLLNPKILHVAAPEDDVLVDGVRRGQLLGAISTPLCAERSDVLERDSGVLRVDLVERADISDAT